jgi:phage portal protein BeeE
MSGLPSISIDSLGNRNSYGLPPLVRNPGTDADKQTVMRWVQVQHRDPPAQATDDRWQQARSFVSGVYIGLRTVMTAMSGATLFVSQRRPGLGQKSQSASGTGPGESDWSPAPPDSPAAKLFSDINANDTPAEFLSEHVLCRGLFGQAVIYAVPNQQGAPVELWHLRSNYLSTLGMSLEYPRGAWLYSMPRPMLWGAVGQLRIPREHTVVHRHPHPLFPWDGYSPLTGGAKLVDFLNSIIDSRQMAMDTGFSPDALVKMAGASQAQIDQFMGYLQTNYTGQNRGRKFLPVNSEQVDIEFLNRPPEEMKYPEGYDQGVAAVLALFGVPASVAGLNEASSYSAFYAAARQFRETTLNAEAKAIGDVLTKHLVRPFFGDEYRVEVKLPPLLDPELEERQIGTLLQADAIKVNELRAKYDLPPLDDGDVTPREREAGRQQQGAGGLVPKVGIDKNGRKFTRMVRPDVPDAADAPPGLPAGDPNAEPAAPGELDNPDVGAASAGSLPGAVQKSFAAGVDWEQYFDRLVEEVVA